MRKKRCVATLAAAILGAGMPLPSGHAQADGDAIEEIQVTATRRPTAA